MVSLCCCLPLRIGVMIIGCFGAIFGLLCFVGLSFMLPHNGFGKIDVRIHLWLGAMISVCYSISCILLVWSIGKKLTVLIKTWLIVHMTFMIILNMMIVYIGFEEGSIVRYSLLTTGLLLYFWMCVLDYYKKIRPEKALNQEPQQINFV